MNSYFFSICYLSSLVLILILVPTSSGSDNEQYTNCRRPFECTSIRNLSYPFWGGSRPQYCGHPNFGLNCTSQAPQITINSIPYRVLSIDYPTKTLTVARAEFWNNPCPSPTTLYMNATLDGGPFAYSNDSENMAILYDCQVTPGVTLSNQFSCTNDGTTTASYFIITSGGDEVSNGSGTLIPGCNSSVVVRVNQTAALGLADARPYIYVKRVLDSGFGLRWDANDPICSGCAQSGGVCGSDSDSGFSCYCSDQVYPVACNSTRGGSGRINLASGRINLALIIGTAVPGVGIMVILSFFIFKILVQSESKFFWKKKTENYLNIEAFLKNCGSLSPKRYSYSDIKKITNSFRTKLGQGGFGNVFKGELKNGSLVAVKVLEGLKGNGDEFINEVATISRTSHVNIVTLLGFCFEGRHRALIYEFMPNGSLDKFIHDGGSLTYRQLGWEALYQIAVGIARGLEYLHRGCNTRILHFDIKPHNILLNEDFCPKISDFGLAKLCPQKDSIISLLGARGTAGYIAPEVFSRNFGGVSHKSDVYSYGMMVLEMVGGRKNISVEVDHTSEIYFPHWVYKRLELDEELGLHGIMDDKSHVSAKNMVIVGLWCIQTDPSHRPSMSRVVEMLEGTAESLQIPPKPFLASPSRAPMDSSTTHVMTL